MEVRSIPSAIISPDASLRQLLQRVVREPRHNLSVEVEIPIPLESIDAESLAKLRRANPELIVLDLEDRPELGLHLAQALTEADPRRRLLAAGPVLEPTLLMEAMKAGICEYLPKPVTADALSGALQRVQRQMTHTAAGGPRKPGNLFAVFSPKGGSGATTVATNLAILIHQLTGKKTLVVDLNLELGEVAVLLGTQSRFSMVDMINNFHRMDAELLASYIERHPSGVHLLSAPFHPGQNGEISGDGIRSVLHFLRQHYDYVMVDTPKSLAPITIATLENADQVLMIATVDIPSLRNVKRCRPLLDQVTQANTGKLRLVINRHQGGSAIPLDEVENTLDMRVFRTLANDYAAVMKSINSGEPVVYDDGSLFSRDLRQLAAEILGLPPEEKEPHGVRHALGRVFSPLLTPRSSRQQPRPRPREALSHG